MQFSDDILTRVAIFILAFCGFWVAKHIRNHKTKNTPLICMVGFDCHTVVHSDYAKFLGMPVELLGMVYYALISLVYLVLILIPNVIPAGSVVFLITLSLIAFLFSAYLISVQIFVLKKGCSWCIVSALVCLLIFILTISSYDISSLAQIFIK